MFIFASLFVAKLEIAQNETKSLENIASQRNVAVDIFSVLIQKRRISDHLRMSKMKKKRHIWQTNLMIIFKNKCQNNYMTSNWGQRSVPASAIILYFLE